MVTLWWSVAGVVSYKFLKTDETIATEKYSEQIDEMYGEFLENSRH